MQNNLTPEQIIQKLAEKKYPDRSETYKWNIDKKREGYKAALRDVLPLIDGWVNVEDRLPDIDDKWKESEYLECFNEYNLAHFIGWYSKGIGWKVSVFNSTGEPIEVTHWRKTNPPGDYSALQKLLEV